MVSWPEMQVVWGGPQSENSDVIQLFNDWLDVLDSK